MATSRQFVTETIFTTVTPINTPSYATRTSEPTLISVSHMTTPIQPQTSVSKPTVAPTSDVSDPKPNVPDSTMMILTLVALLMLLLLYLFGAGLLIVKHFFHKPQPQTGDETSDMEMGNLAPFTEEQPQEQDRGQTPANNGLQVNEDTLRRLCGISEDASANSHGSRDGSIDWGDGRAPPWLETPRSTYHGSERPSLHSGSGFSEGFQNSSSSRRPLPRPWLQPIRQASGISHTLHTTNTVAPQRPPVAHTTDEDDILFQVKPTGTDHGAQQRAMSTYSLERVPTTTALVHEPPSRPPRTPTRLNVHNVGAALMDKRRRMNANKPTEPEQPPPREMWFGLGNIPGLRGW